MWRSLRNTITNYLRISSRLTVKHLFREFRLE